MHPLASYLCCIFAVFLHKFIQSPPDSLVALPFRPLSETVLGCLQIQKSGKENSPTSNCVFFWPTLSSCLSISASPRKIHPSVPKLPVWEKNKLRYLQLQVSSFIHAIETDAQVKSIKSIYSEGDETSQHQHSLQKEMQAQGQGGCYDRLCKQNSWFHDCGQVFSPPSCSPVNERGYHVFIYIYPLKAFKDE